MRTKLNIILLFFISIIAESCHLSNQKSDKATLSKNFNSYWYNNQAELTSYKLEQARYGEIHKGHAVLIFVTEPFNAEKQVKADNPSENDISVLKLNFTKKFTTGIYPYSMMTSSFVDVNQTENHALKITTTSQDWCGHTFTQLNNQNNKFKIQQFSYFEEEGDNSKTIKTCWLEDELWSKLRINPHLLPQGEVDMLPSFFYIRLMHKTLKPYKATINIENNDDSTSIYKIEYHELKRNLNIHFSNNFPYTILGWEETYVSGWGDKAKLLTTKATKNRSLKIDYWTKHDTTDAYLRKDLGL